MLTVDLVRPRLQKKGKQAEIEMLSADDPHWLNTTAELITMFADHVGKNRDAWDATFDAYESERSDYIVLRGLSKVLCDEASFETLTLPITPSEIRQRIFASGTPPTNAEAFFQEHAPAVYAAIAAEYNLTPELVEASLFADHPGTDILKDIGPAWTPIDLMQRYNLEVLRGMFYLVTKIQIDIHDSFADVWRYLKLFRLVFWATPLPKGGYRVVIDGPVSPIVLTATRYGRQCAAFLSALFLCRGWSLTADIRPGADPSVRYKLNEKAPLVSYYRARGTFDSHLELDLAAEFLNKFSTTRGNWWLAREHEPMLLDGVVMLPDFSFAHNHDGRRAFMELVGFWHPKYLQRKLEKIRAANRRDLILIVFEGMNLTGEPLKEVPQEVLYFKHRPVLKEVLAAVERVAI